MTQAGAGRDPNATSTSPTTSSAPTSAAPTSAAPTSAAPTSAAPTSAAPTSAAPTSAAPTIIAPGGHNGATLRSGKAWLVLIAAALLGLGADLWTKGWAFRTVAGMPVVIDREQAAGAPRPSLLIPYHDPVVVVPNLLDFTLVLNPGAVFGMGAGKRWFFVTLTGIALLMGIWLFAVWTRPRQWWAHIAIGLVLAGGLGNLYDRVVYACVRDFIHPLPGVKYPFGWDSPWSGREIWPWVSNVADKLLIIGIAILIWHILIGWKKRA